MLVTGADPINLLEDSLRLNPVCDLALTPAMTGHFPDLPRYPIDEGA